MALASSFRFTLLAVLALVAAPACGGSAAQESIVAPATAPIAPGSAATEPPLPALAPPSPPPAGGPTMMPAPSHVDVRFVPNGAIPRALRIGKDGTIDVDGVPALGVDIRASGWRLDARQDAGRFATAMGADVRIFIGCDIVLVLRGGGAYDLRGRRVLGVGPDGAVDALGLGKIGTLEGVQEDECGDVPSGAHSSELTCPDYEPRSRRLALGVLAAALAAQSPGWAAGIARGPC
jgi:hypothetical protein